MREGKGKNEKGREEKIRKGKGRIANPAPLFTEYFGYKMHRKFIHTLWRFSDVKSLRYLLTSKLLVFFSWGKIKTLHGRL